MFLLSLLLFVPHGITTTGTPAFHNEVDNENQLWSTDTQIWDNSHSLIPIPFEGTSTPQVLEGFHYISGEELEDHYDDEEETIITPPPYVHLDPCPFDRCRHLEVPCEETQRRAGGNCLCPGISGSAVPPDSPRLGEIIAGDSGASVTWCSPLSTVQGYRVMYGTPDGPLENGPILNGTYRFYSIENLLPDTSYRVCVVAFNEAGESQADVEEAEEWGWAIPGPCKTFHTFGSLVSHLYLGVGVGLSVLAGVLGLTVMGYWLCKRGKGRGRKWVRGEDMGISNLSYKAESIEHL